jgi:integrase
MLSPYVFVRPGNLRNAEWSEINFPEKRWEISGPKMKMKKDFIVPLSRQAIEILQDLKPLTGNGKYVFPCHRTTLKPMSENAILAALRRMGYGKDEMTGHGFRAMARTMIRERLKADTEYIEIQLAHVTKNANGTAYDRVAFIDERTDMMQIWADYIDELRSGKNT